MNPTLKNGNYLLANRLAYNSHMPKHGDIIIFKSNLKNSKVLIKRVIAIQGDNVKVQNGEVYVNGEKLKENYINGNFTSGEIDETIQDNKVFVMGDNRGNSLDSRYDEIGQVSIDNIIGKICVGIYPMKIF